LAGGRSVDTAFARILHSPHPRIERDVLQTEYGTTMGDSDVLLAHLTWEEAEEAASRNTLVIIPTGATEAHGPHLPLDVDTHQVAHVAELLARRVGALVAPALPYGYSSTWMHFPGTVSLSTETFQRVLEEICASLLTHGFRRLLILNGHRPNGTACDVAARAVVDTHPRRDELEITAVSYWEPAAKELHALRRSVVGGMGHACELETSFQLATRPQLVRMERLAGKQTPLVNWDLVAPVDPSRTYGPWPDPRKGHLGVFGDPFSASADSGARFLEPIVDRLAAMLGEIEQRGGSYTGVAETRGGYPGRSTPSS
jgi:creatinine amidohydrolase